MEEKGRVLRVWKCQGNGEKELKKVFLENETVTFNVFE